MNKLKYIFIIIALIFLNIFILFKWYDSNRINQKIQNDIILVEDTVKYLKDKNNEYFAQNKAYILEIDDLKKINKNLSDELKYMKENPLIVEKIKTIVQMDTTYLENDISKNFQNGIYNFSNNFYYEQIFDDKNSLYLNGTSYLSLDTLFNIKTNSTYLNKLELKTDLTLSFTEYKNELHINAKSNNPLVSISELNGYILNKDTYKTIKKYQKPKRFYFGFGVNYQYNFSTAKFEPGLGLSAGIKIFEF